VEGGLRDAVHRRVLVDLGRESVSGAELMRRSQQVDPAMAIVLIRGWNIGRMIRS
jgi:hypothetical protein